jgi:hypothetical protein
MKDIFGQELKGGDIVAFASQSYNKGRLRFAVILKTGITHKLGSRVLIRAVNPYGTEYNTFTLLNTGFATPGHMMKILDLFSLPHKLVTTLSRAWRAYDKESQTAEVVEKEVLDMPIAPKFRPQKISVPKDTALVRKIKDETRNI